MGRLIEFLVMVDAEDACAALTCRSHADAADLGLEESSGYTGSHEICREPVEIRQAGAQQEAGNFGTVPLDRKSDRCIPEDAEVVAEMRVLPDVFRIENQVLAERLLEPGVEFVAPSGAERIGDAGKPLKGGLQGVYNRIVAAAAGQNKILVERSFHGARIGNTQNGIRWFDVVSDSQAGLRLALHGQSVVEIAAYAQIKCPVSFGDGVLNVEGRLLHIRVPAKEMGLAARGQIDWPQGGARRSDVNAGDLAGSSVGIGQRRQQVRIHDTE